MSATAYRITDLRDLDAAFTIREKVFQQEQGVPASKEHDEHDRTDARHYLARAADGTPAGAARWRQTDNGVKLERFAVLSDFRNQEIGAALLHAVLTDVKAEIPDAEVYLNAQRAPFRSTSGTASGKKVRCSRRLISSTIKWCWGSGLAQPVEPHPRPLSKREGSQGTGVSLISR
ncbi:GNAT family N-acetyltransferase [Hymenobacter humi]